MTPRSSSAQVLKDLQSHLILQGAVEGSFTCVAQIVLLPGFRLTAAAAAATGSQLLLLLLLLQIHSCRRAIKSSIGLRPRPPEVLLGS